MGRPIPLPAADSFTFFFQSLEGRGETEDKFWLTFFGLDKYRKRFIGAHPEHVFTYYKGVLARITSRPRRDQLLTYLAELLNDAAPNRSLSRSLEDFLANQDARIAQLQEDEEENERPLREALRDQKIFFDKTQGQLGRHLGEPGSQQMGDWARRARTRLCIRHEIPCGDWVPDLERLRKMLRSKKASRRVEALQLIMENSELASALEADWVESLQDAAQEGLEEGSGVEVFRETLPVAARVVELQARTLETLLKGARRFGYGIQPLHKVHGKRIEPLYVAEFKAAPDSKLNVTLLDLRELKRFSDATCQALRERARLLKKNNSTQGAFLETLLGRCP